MMNENFTIIEIKPKLNTPLQNVTLVTTTSGGDVIGEVQLKVEKKNIGHAHF